MARRIKIHSLPELREALPYDNDRLIQYLESINLDSFVFDGTVFRGIREITENGTVNDADYTILANAGSNAIALTIYPANAGNVLRDGFYRVFNIKKIDATDNEVTVTVQSGGTIDGHSSVILTSQNESITIQTNGTSWYII